MEFKREKKTAVKVDIYGQSFEMRMPSVDEREELLAILETEHSQAKLWKYQKTFVSKLGLPMEVIKEMEDEHFNELAKVFVSPKKN